MPVRLEIELDDDQVRAFLRPKNFSKKFNTHFSQQLAGFHSHMKKRIKQQMENGNYPALGITQYTGVNGPRSPNKSLVDTRAFQESLKAHYVRESEYLSGLDFVFEGATSSGLPYSKLAWILEEGRTWTPTQKERAAVAAKAKEGGAPEPEGRPKAHWHIPSRPFLRDSFDDVDVWEDFLNRTYRAMELAFDELKAGGG